MRIREVHAHGFGSLIDQQLDLSPGVTVIAGPNESGKSTWQVALATAVTGLPKRRQTKADRSFTERYEPWVGDVFALSAVVEVDGGLYRVHRDLAKGVDSVFDERTGQDVTSRFVHDGTCDLSRFVGLDRRTLPLAALVQQGEILAVTQAGGEGDTLRSFLQRAAASRSDADVTAELAIGRIDKFVKDALGSDRRNSTKPLRSAIDAAHTALLQLDAALEADAAGTRLRTDLAAADQRLSELRDELQRSEFAEAEAALAGQQAELAEAERVEQQLVAARSRMSRASADTHDPQELRRLAWELEQPAPLAAAPTRDVRVTSPQPQRRVVNDRAFLGLAGVGAGAVVLAFVAAALSWLGVAAVIGLACLGLAILIGSAFASRRLRDARAEIRQQAAEAQRREVIERERQAQIDELHAEHQRRLGEAASAARHLGLEPDPHTLSAAAAHIEQVAKESAAARIEVSTAQAALDGLLRGRTISDLRGTAAEQARRVDALRSSERVASAERAAVAPDHVATLRRSIDVASRDREDLVARLAASAATVGDLTTLHEEHDRAVAERDRLVKLRELTDRTRAFLDQARAEVHREIAPRLASVTEERLARVTAGRYKELRVDPEDLSVRLRTETGVWRPAGSVSLGTQEQVYLLLRSAIAELVAPNHEPCPLLLDEVTVHADSERLAALLDLVELLAESRQVILFTQEDRVLDWAQRAGHRIAVLERP